MTAFLSLRPVTPRNAPRAAFAAHPSPLRAASHNLEPADAYRAAVLRKRCGRKGIPCLSCPCRIPGFWAARPWNGAEQGGTSRHIEEHPFGRREIARLSAPTIPFPRRTCLRRGPDRLRKPLRKLKLHPTKNYANKG